MVKGWGKERKKGKRREKDVLSLGTNDSVLNLRKKTNSQLLKSTTVGKKISWKVREL